MVAVPTNDFVPGLAQCRGNIYFHGYWINCHWLKSNFYEVLKHELQFAPLVEKTNLRYAEKEVQGTEYFIFSDDMDWCRENMEALGLNKVKDRVHFVEENTKENSFRDMQLMSLCKVNILVTSSSFSYLAALLNQNEDRIVINGTGREV